MAYTVRSYVEEYWEEDPKVVAQINQNNADIEIYQTTINDLNSLKSVTSECKSNLDCCYSNITLAIVLDADPGKNEEFFSNINGYAKTMSEQSEKMTTQIENINNKISQLQMDNAELEKVKMVLKTRTVYY